MANYAGGVFLGSVLLSAKGQIGGSRSVFVKLQGNKNDLVFPPYGGVLKNPFRGKAKIYAGDLFEYRTNDDGVKPELYLLKTFKVNKGTSTASVEVVSDGFLHIPFVGDVLMKAPDTLGGAGTAATVTAVVKGNGIYTITLSGAIGTLEQGDVLVEGVAAGSTTMLVKNINAMAACDYDTFYEPALSDEDAENARYLLTPVLHGTAFKSKMSPLPACADAVNKSRVNGWFEI